MRYQYGKSFGSPSAFGSLRGWMKEHEAESDSRVLSMKEGLVSSQIPSQDLSNSLFGIEYK